MKFYFLILFVWIFASSSFAQTSNCSVSSDSITIRGFRLGMTETESKKRYPKLEFIKDREIIGLSYFNAGNPYSSLDNYFAEDEQKDLNSIEIKFLDNSLSELRITYDGFTEWDSLQEFTDKSATGLKLPLSASWQKHNPISLKLVCKDFYVISTLEPKLGQYELQVPRLYFSFNNFKEKLNARKEEKKDAKKKEFKP